MRLTLFLCLLAGIVLVSMMLLPARRADLPVPPGQVPPPPTVSRCYAITYQGVRRPGILPHSLKLLRDTTSWLLRRRTYRAIGDGDHSWHEAYWAYAGSDSIDVTAHHQAILRFSLKDAGGPGRGEPYLDGPLLPALLFPVQGSFGIRSHRVPCSGG